LPPAHGRAGFVAKPDPKIVDRSLSDIHPLRFDALLRNAPRRAPTAPGARVFSGLDTPPDP